MVCSTEASPSATETAERFLLMIWESCSEGVLSLEEMIPCGLELPRTMRSFLLVRRRFCLALDEDTLVEATAEDVAGEVLLRFAGGRVEEVAVEVRRRLELAVLWLLGRGLFRLAFQSRYTIRCLVFQEWTSAFEYVCSLTSIRCASKAMLMRVNTPQS